jgi:uncharacterized protein YuzE
VSETGKRFQFGKWVIEIDDEAGACYVYADGVIPDRGVAFSRSVDSEKVSGIVNADYDKSGKLLGVEIIP